MNRNEFEKAVKESELDPTSRHILLHYAYCKNWQKNTWAFPSAVAVARATGYGIASIKRRMRYLRDTGWLVDTGERRGRGVIVYDLAVGSSITVIPQVYQSDTGGYQSDTAEVSERYTEQVNTMKIEQVREQVTNQAPSALDSDWWEEPSEVVEALPAPKVAGRDDSSNLDTSSNPNNVVPLDSSLTSERTKAPRTFAKPNNPRLVAEVTIIGNRMNKYYEVPLTKEELNEVVELACSPDFKPEITDAGQLWGWALEHFNNERTRYDAEAMQL